jgi:hypothetical protein
MLEELVKVFGNRTSIAYFAGLTARGELGRF